MTETFTLPMNMLQRKMTSHAMMYAFMRRRRARRLGGESEAVEFGYERVEFGGMGACSLLSPDGPGAVPRIGVGTGV